MKRLLSMLCALTLTLGMLPAASAASDTLTAGGWFESLYAQLPGFTDSQVTAVSYSGTMSGSLTGDDFTYLVRDVEDGVRVDIPGLKAGTYDLSVTAGGQTYTATGIRVMAHDRSGYAHWNYTEGVGAYNDDGTLKANAVVLYVTDENKETVALTATNDNGKNFTVTGIGSILRAGSSKNQSILKRLATNNKAPLVIRVVGTVTAPKDLSSANFYKDSNNEWDGDNGYMADIVGGANITIEGIGADAVIDGWGFSFGVNTDDTKKGLGKNLEVRNLSFQNVPEDCVGIGGKNIDSDPITHTWVHNNAFHVPAIPLLQSPNTSDKPYTWVEDKQQGDGAMDWKVAKYHTMSYNYFEGYHKTNLIGGNNSQKQYHATWHHNWWKDCESRGPLCRQTDIHIYNNLYDGNSQYCMSLRASCFIFSEYNTFLGCTDPMRQNSSATDGTGQGLCKSFNDTFTNCKGKKEANFVTDRTEKVTHAQNYNPYANFDTDASMSYIPGGDYQLDDTATAEANIKAYAGPMKPADEAVTPGHRHQWSDWTETKAPTCTEAGEKTRTCTAADCPLGSQTQAVPALGHNYVNNVCTRCGAKLRGKTYTLTGNEVFADLATDPVKDLTLATSGSNQGSYVASAATSGKGGTDDFFTLLYGQNSRVDPNAKTFDDGFAGTHRINFSNKAETTQNAIGFKTDGPAKVKVWWVGAVAASEITSSKQPRPMVILDSAGKEAAVSETVADNTTLNISSFDLADAGTYYLGGKGGKNFIFRVDVTVGVQEEEKPDPDAVDWGTLTGDNGQDLKWMYTQDERVVITTGTLQEDEMVLVGCYNERGCLTGVKLLTRAEFAAQLEAGAATVKLFWLNGGQEPLCQAVTVEK